MSRVGAENPVTSCDLQVFVDEATEPVASLTPDWWCCGWGCGQGCVKVT
jgi:hypothetical protein